MKSCDLDLLHELVRISHLAPTPANFAKFARVIQRAEREHAHPKMVRNPSWAPRVFEPTKGKNKGKTFMFFPKDVCCETEQRIKGAGLTRSKRSKGVGHLWVK